MRREISILGALALVLMIVLVLAEPSWDSSAYNDVYYLTEDSVYLHNFTSNLSDSSNLSHFLILDIDWQGGSLGPSHDDFYWIPWNDSSFDNSTLGVARFNASRDNETGNFTLNVFAQGEQTGTSAKFNFIVNATNDAPYFTNLVSSYVFNQDIFEYHDADAFDEEGHYPLDFNLTWINNCTHANWSGRNSGENCSIFNLTYNGLSSTRFQMTPGINDVGVYWANFSAQDFNATCPHSYCDSSSYEVNMSSGWYLLRFDVLSSLSINASNCSGSIVMEGEAFNCTINITTRGSSDPLNFSSYGFFAPNPLASYNNSNRDWFYSNNNDSSSNYFYSFPVSVVPDKSEVGNWTINFSVSDGNVTRADQIGIYVNYTESSVSLGAIEDLVIYRDETININASDEDLRIWDTSVKDEVLTFFTNESSWFSVGTPVTISGNNYSEVDLDINHSYALSNFGEGNRSVLVNVTDVAGNVDSRVFVVEVKNESAPEWSALLDDPVSFDLVEGMAFSYNLSVNVSDAENDTIVFYYEDLSSDLCSLNGANFNSNGMISFTPVDCDVGLHNFNILAGDGKLNSTYSFVFNVTNVYDVPGIDSFTGENSSGQSVLSEGFSFFVKESEVINFSLLVSDDDFLIPSAQRAAYYDESLTVNVSFIRSNGSSVDLFDFYFVGAGSPGGENVLYEANFTPGIAELGDYTVFVNVTDSVGNSTSRSFFLNVTENLDPPVLEFIDNMSLTVYDVLSFTVNASDNEDDFNVINLSYTITAMDSGAPNLTIDSNQLVSFDMGVNLSLAGVWRYNVSVVDSDYMSDEQIFYLFVYGPASMVAPAQGSVFNLTENVSSLLNFSINHSVGDDLTYVFWIDDVSCSYLNNSDCSWGNLTHRENLTGTGDGSVYSWNFAPNYTDETYGLLKNLTVQAYPNVILLNSSQKSSVATNFSFKLNVSHTNAPMRVVSPLGKLTGNYGGYIDVDLGNYFSDEDYEDSYWRQSIGLSKTGDSHANIHVSHSGGWSVRISESVGSAFTGFVDILGDDNLTSDILEDVEIEFVAPTTTSSSSTTRTVVKYFSLRIIVPEDVIIDDENYIDVPFSLINNGNMNLHGINLGSQVLYNNEFTDDVKINLGEDYLESLKVGEKKDYTMRILADTQRSGRYKATLFANVSSPLFSDWGDFFIDLRKTNESEAEELLVFVDKIVSENPECLELTEGIRRAREAFESGNEAEAIRLANEVSEACEDAISANEQIRYRVEGFVEKNFYYIAFLTLLIFFSGFIFYIWKRVRFNNSVEGDYIREDEVKNG